jgi:hypothetical protein
VDGNKKTVPPFPLSITPRAVGALTLQHGGTKPHIVCSDGAQKMPAAYRRNVPLLDTMDDANVETFFISAKFSCFLFFYSRSLKDE